MGLAMFAGTIALADFAALGLGLRGTAAGVARQIAPQIAPWTRAGLAVMLATGVVLFFTDRARYLDNPAFRLKMALVVLALLAHFTIHRQAGRTPAVLSLVLWTSAVLAARAIADFDL